MKLVLIIYIESNECVDLIKNVKVAFDQSILVLKRVFEFKKSF